MIIRPATSADWPAIWPLLRDVFRAGETYAIDPGITQDAAQHYWMDSATATYVACDAGQVVGTYYIGPNQPGGGAHICNCGYIVAPTAQGQGIAAQMCKASQTQARDLGYRAMQFNFVLASNARAIRLWHRLGYTTLGIIPEAFDHPKQGLVDAHIMHKRLA